jgi:RNA polymerase sigma-B factor
MQQHLRDREQPLRCSRQLRDLHRRGQALQQERLHHHLHPLDDQAIAAALSCPPERWREACALQRALQLRSLDAPVQVGEEGALPLVELIPSGEAPHPFRVDHREESPCCEPESQHWLRQRLRRLDPLLRQLLEGRVLNGASWRQLGEDVGLHARVAQRRFDGLVVQLREEFGADLGDLFSPPSRAAAPGPSPAGRRSASAAH